MRTRTPLLPVQVLSFLNGARRSKRRFASAELVVPARPTILSHPYRNVLGFGIGVVPQSMHLRGPGDTKPPACLHQLRPAFDLKNSRTNTVCCAWQAGRHGRKSCPIKLTRKPSIIALLPGTSAAMVLDGNHLPFTIVSGMAPMTTASHTHPSMQMIPISTASHTHPSVQHGGPHGDYPIHPACT